MRILALIAIFAAAATAAGPRQLFDGKDLAGWEFLGQRPGSQGFTVKDGLLVSTGEKGMLWCTREKIGNAKLRVVWMMSNEKGNSGVFIRIPVEPKTESTAINKGIEVQIDDRDNDYHCTGVLYSMTKAMARPSKGPNQWNTLEITIDGQRTIVLLNGVKVTDYDGHAEVPPKVHPWEPDRGPRPDEGYIGVQAHDPSAVITFKEISVEPLSR